MKKTAITGGFYLRKWNLIFPFWAYMPDSQKEFFAFS
jgi:hypothetical protein